MASFVSLSAQEGAGLFRWGQKCMRCLKNPQLLLLNRNLLPGEVGTRFMTLLANFVSMSGQERGRFLGSERVAPPHPTDAINRVPTLGQ